MQDLLCPICQKSYDLVNKIPKILPNSQKTICEECVEEIISKDSGVGTCPFTSQPFR